MLQGWLPGKGYGWGRRFIIISIILGICLAVALGAPFDSAQVGQTLCIMWLPCLPSSVTPTLQSLLHANL